MSNQDTGDLSRERRGILAHTLGLPSGHGPYRNHFAAEPGSPDHAVIEGLVEAGLMKAGRTVPDDTGLRYYHVTEAGRAAIGAPAALYPEDVCR